MEYFVIEWDETGTIKDKDGCVKDTFVAGERYVIVSEETYKEVLNNFGYEEEDMPKREATKEDFKKLQVVDLDWIIHN